MQHSIAKYEDNHLTKQDEQAKLSQAISPEAQKKIAGDNEELKISIG